MDQRLLKITLDCGSGSLASGVAAPSLSEDVTGVDDGDNMSSLLEDGEVDRMILSLDEQQKREALWEKMHRPFLKDKDRKRKIKETEQLNVQSRKQNNPAKNMKKHSSSNNYISNNIRQC
jgi:hypothetical protein